MLVKGAAAAVISELSSESDVMEGMGRDQSPESGFEGGLAMEEVEERFEGGKTRLYASRLSTVR